VRDGVAPTGGGGGHHAISEAHWAARFRESQDDDRYSGRRDLFVPRRFGAGPLLAAMLPVVHALCRSTRGRSFRILREYGQYFALRPRVRLLPPRAFGWPGDRLPRFLRAHGRFRRAPVAIAFVCWQARRCAQPGLVVAAPVLAERRVALAIHGRLNHWPASALPLLPVRARKRRQHVSLRLDVAGSASFLVPTWRWRRFAPVHSLRPRIRSFSVRLRFVQSAVPLPFVPARA